jgi:hypothetical protein
MALRCYGVAMASREAGSAPRGVGSAPRGVGRAPRGVGRAPRGVGRAPRGVGGSIFRAGALSGAVLLCISSDRVLCMGDRGDSLKGP